jgi:hypothetical protein
MPLKKLVLGIGNESKSILKPLENDFPGYQFGILDCWSKVQDIKTESQPPADHTSHGVWPIHDCSYFIIPSSVAIKFEDSKFEDSETHKLIRYKEYAQLLEREKQKSFKEIIQLLDGYSEILMVGPADDEISFEFLLDIVSALQQKSNITIFSWYPIVFHSNATNMISAFRLSEQLIETDAKQFVLFQHEYLEQYKDYNASEAMRMLDEVKREGVRSLMLGNIEFINKIMNM